jgi:predicted nucleotidyltransferase
MVDDENKNCIVRFLTERFPNLRAIYLFGSSLTPDERVKGDIDLAILPKNPIPPWERWKAAQDLAVRLKTAIDLVDLRRASTVMQLQVITSGQCLYEQETEEREIYENSVFSAYARLNEERRGILEDVYARGSVYG